MPRQPYISKAKITIDSHKHDDQIKSIEEAQHEAVRLDYMDAKNADIKEARYEVEDKFDDLDNETVQNKDSYQVGRIDLSFPETVEEFKDSIHCYPPSYYTISAKERLLLLYAENFRHQFVINNSKRRPLVLALPNECNVQKFVCTTIRPTSFLHRPLIRNAEECASFVADFIIYEPLDDMMSFVSTLYLF
ncbi:Coiled-coil domain-containing protein lobo [Lucilia cuprina]|uniref:Coiled-coil domain-containing protein lobo n=1 Tax=Lucilia cuprina TaxID=7375 RepID=A0A0L0BV68_LUCCU|nr:Coiled-coil domain-containing protein lobo [Lucilia cuprina]KNC23960.1 Coiled-coil domain-containing protein lobo [Lucilia cuprina]